MELTLVEENGIRAVEGQPGGTFMSRVEDASRIVEACLSARTRSALLYGDNLTDRFFDVSSREAGEILQKLRTYRVRLAVVCAPGARRFSSRFAELVAAERQYFGVFDTRTEARAWLGQAVA